MRCFLVLVCAAIAIDIASAPSEARQAIDDGGLCPGGVMCPAEHVSMAAPSLTNPWGETAEEALPKVRMSARNAFYFFGAGSRKSVTGLWNWSADEKQLEERARDLHIWAALGDTDSRFRLGIAYFVGAGSFAHPQSACLSARFFNATAEQGNPLGMAALSYMHVLGLGVVKNHEKALHYWRLALISGDGEIMKQGHAETGIVRVLDRAIAAKSVEAATWMEDLRDLKKLPPQPETGQMLGPLALDLNQCPQAAANTAP